MYGFFWHKNIITDSRQYNQKEEKEKKFTKMETGIKYSR